MITQALFISELFATREVIPWGLFQHWWTMVFPGHACLKHKDIRMYIYIYIHTHFWLWLIWNHHHVKVLMTDITIICIHISISQRKFKVDRASNFVGDSHKPTSSWTFSSSTKNQWHARMLLVKNFRMPILLEVLFGSSDGGESSLNKGLLTQPRAPWLSGFWRTFF